MKLQKAKMSLRKDEEFVIRAIADYVSGSWVPGDDPPDAYLKINDEEIAVEISTLTQHIGNDDGTSRPRLSDDLAAIKIINELNSKLKSMLNKKRSVHIYLKSPLSSMNKFKAGLLKAVKELLINTDLSEEKVKLNILGNEVRIAIFTDNHDCKICGGVYNKNSNPDVLHNARYILEERIADKSLRCGSLGYRGQLWLALYNDYFIADSAAYRAVLADISIKHPFDRILIVHSDKTVGSLYEASLES